MRKVISLSALVSGLLAAPGLGAPLARAAGAIEGQADVGSMVAGEPALSPSARKKLDEELGALAEHGPADVGGMRALQEQMVAEMLSHLEHVRQLQGMRLQNLQVAEGPAAPAPAPQPPAEGQGMTFQLIPAPGGGMQQMEKACFLGVTASPVPGLLREQLELPKGVGLVVDFVAKDSPAEAAGLKVHDVLHKLDDQLIVNVPQLTVLVRAKKAGDTVTLTVIRGAKPVELKAKLVERDVPVMEEGGGGNMILNFGGGPGLMLSTDPQTPAPAEEPGAWKKKMQTRVVAQEDGSTVATMEDGENVIVLTTDKDGKKTLAAKNKEGREIFSGAYNSDAEKKGVPAALAAKVAAMEAMQANGAVVVSMERKDAEHVIRLTVNGTDKSVVVTDAKTGKVLYEGPANSDEDLKKMPDGVAEKVKALEAKTGRK